MNIPPLQLLMLGAGVLFTLILLAFAFAGPSAGKAQSRRVEALKTRNRDGGGVTLESQMRKITANRHTKMDSFFRGLIPNPAELQRRLSKTGKSWSVGKYMMTSLVLMIVVGGLAWIKIGNPLLALFVGLAIGIFLPHKIVGMQISTRLKKFTLAAMSFFPRPYFASSTRKLV